jgi:hypothetical protein
MSIPISRSSFCTMLLAVGASNLERADPLPRLCAQEKFRQIDISGTIARSW